MNPGTRFQSAEAGGEREGSAGGRSGIAGLCGAVSAGRGQAVSGWDFGSPRAAWTSGLQHAAPACSSTHLWGPQEKEEDFWIWVSAAAPQGSAGAGEAGVTESDCEPLIAPTPSLAIPSCALLLRLPRACLWTYLFWEGERGELAPKARNGA